MRKIYVIGLLLVLLLPFTASAESSVWRVKTAKGVLYVAGTVHVLRDEDYPLPPEFEKAYAETDNLVLETDLGAVNQQEVQSLMLSRGMYPQGETLKDNLDDAVYQRLAAYCRERNLPLANLQQLRPWMLILTLTVSELQANGFDPENGVDMHLYQRALKDGKPVHGLESFTEQIEAMASLEDSLDEAVVEQFLDDMAALNDDVDAMVKAWRKGDLKGLERVVSDVESDPALHRALLVDRNKRWLPQIEQWATSDKKSLVVVGAAHLVGESNVLELLRQRGYVVEQYSIP